MYLLGNFFRRNHLSDIGAVNYNAWWCPHCQEQRALFGREAAELMPYTECDGAGRDPQVETCRAADISGYPSWAINGKLYSGTQTLNALADASGYTGARDFIHQLPSR